MFYCETCRVERNWPEGWSMSKGPCELCKQVRVCYDVSSNHLPDPPPPKNPETNKG